MDIVVYAALCEGENEHETARRLLALALRREYGIETLPPFALGEKGKPYFPDYPEIHFNISHSHGAAVAAVHDKSIGIDIEKLRPAPKKLSAGMEDAVFFRQWTAKEATIKRCGGSIAVVLRQEIRPDPLCCTLDDLLPGWIITVCPSENAPMRLCNVSAERR